jgi:ribonuclease HII
VEQRGLEISADVLVAGVDEAGRGPLAGPVFAAAVILDPDAPIAGIADSKALSPRRREALELEIKDRALAWAVARSEVDEIDRLNILQASLLAMSRAVSALARQPGYVLVDGNQCPRLSVPAEPVVKGDGSVACIGAASILAKEARDREMVALDRRYPAYGFAAHKGYPTRQHIEALMEHGVTPVHRRTYAPVRRALERV